MLKQREITFKTLQYLIGDTPSIKIKYNDGTESIAIKHKDGEVISNINQYLLDNFPHYMSNIDYGENWLTICCVSSKGGK